MSNLSEIVAHLQSASEEKFKSWPQPKYAPGQIVHATVPFMEESAKIHIVHILPSVYAHWLIIYKVYGQHKQWWHEFMCSDNDMDWYIKKANEGL